MDFRFAFWTRQFPGQRVFQPVVSGIITAENSRFCPFWEIIGTTGLKSESPWTSA
jgi:hypothetical protein